MVSQLRKPEKKLKKTKKKPRKVATWKPMSILQETYLQGLTKLSLGKLIPDLTLYLLLYIFPLKVSRFPRTEETGKTGKNRKLNWHIADEH